MTFANAAALGATDGFLYCQAAPVPGLESDLGSPLSIPYGQAVAASVELSAVGALSSNQTYIVLQTSVGGAWYDVAWATFSALVGSFNCLLTGGAPVGAAVPQSRAAGSPPAGNGANQCVLGGAIRFVGKSSLGTGSSSSSGGPGAAPQVLCTVRLHVVGLR
jgi:hypothetical protein